MFLLKKIHHVACLLRYNNQAQNFLSVDSFSEILPELCGWNINATRNRSFPILTKFYTFFRQLVLSIGNSSQSQVSIFLQWLTCGPMQVLIRTYMPSTHPCTYLMKKEGSSTKYKISLHTGKSTILLQHITNFLHRMIHTGLDMVPFF